MRLRREDWINWRVAIVVGLVIYAALFSPGARPFGLGAVNAASSLRNLVRQSTPHFASLNGSAA
jgi:hypothetical protein